MPFSLTASGANTKHFKVLALKLLSASRHFPHRWTTFQMHYKLTKEPRAWQWGGRNLSKWWKMPRRTVRKSCSNRKPEHLRLPFKLPGTSGTSIVKCPRRTGTSYLGLLLHLKTLTDLLIHLKLQVFAGCTLIFTVVFILSITFSSGLAATMAQVWPS